MSGDTFYKTRMGQVFFDHTLPELVRSLQTLSTHLEALAQQSRTADRIRPAEAEAGADDLAKTVYVDTVYIGTRVQPIHGQRVRICGVFRDHDEVPVDVADAIRPPARVQRWSDVSGDCWAYVAAFSSRGFMSPTLDAVSVRDLECFAHLSPAAPKGQP